MADFPDNLKPYSTADIISQIGVDQPSALTDVPEFTIVQDVESNPRSISLRGRSLPQTPLEFTGEQRTATTYYPGNPSATQQILGTTWGSTTVGGVWKYRFIGDPEKNVFSYNGFPELEVDRHPAILVRAFDILRDDGKPVVVTWGEWQRKGILKRFSATWKLAQEVEWEAEFEWQNLGDDVLFAARPEIPGSDVLTETILLDDILALEPFFVIPNFNAFIQSRLKDFRGKVGRVFDALRFAADQSTTPFNTIQNLATLAAGILADYEVLANKFLEEPYSQASLVDSVLDTLAVTNWQRSSGRGVGEVYFATQRTTDTYTEENAPGAIQVVITPYAITLRDLATQFYGDPDSWQLIADVNGFVDSLVPEGTAVIIPATPQPRDNRSTFIREDSP